MLENWKKKLLKMKEPEIPIVISALGRVTKSLIHGLEDMEIGGQIGTIETTAFFYSGQNNEKSPVDLKRLAFTLIENHQLTQVWKTRKWVEW